MPNLILPDPVVIAVIVFVFGTMIGSFLNVVIFRLPADESIVWPGSHCPQCQTALSAWENIPIVSWIALRARCKTCKLPISWRYPAIELVTGLLFVAVYGQFGLTWQTLLLCVLVGLMTAVFWIDWDTMLIFDQITIPGAVLGLVYSFFITDQFWSALSACLFAVAFLLLINSLTVLAIGEDGIGGGDMTLVAMLGAWLGLSQTGVALAIAMVVGSLMGLLVLYARWGKAGHWQPFLLALGGMAPAYVMACLLFANPAQGLLPGWWWGAGLAPQMQAAAVILAVMLGAVSGWVYMRSLRDEGRLVMPFGPALVIGGLVALFGGAPLAAAVMSRFSI